MTFKHIISAQGFEIHLQHVHRIEVSAPGKKLLQWPCPGLLHSLPPSLHVIPFSETGMIEKGP